MELWAQDEARLGLIPVVRRVWAARGERPLALGQRRYQWLYLYGFVRPGSGEVQWLILPEVDTDIFSLALKHFAEAVGAGPYKRIVLVLDGAGWHASKHLVVPEGIHLVFLPAYSPELQPAEHLWPLVRESMANRRIETLEELEDLIAERCRALAANKETIRSSTFFHWWPIDYAN
ncbi:MAG TPA: IS630 family transposase [Anaeromyxobacteraceae bacterium]|nr:IS630 family transposase [Anaeromyxobacteraceae bacterium]